MSRLADGRPLFLVGFMGCGKTTSGEALARLTGRPFVDTDRLIEQREQRPIERIFADCGESTFRAAERAALRSVDLEQPCVVATGGGLFTSFENRRWTKAAGATIWLDVSLDEARRRLGQGQGRPLWCADDPIALRALFERRRTAYALCHFRVAVGRGTAEEVAERLVREFL